MKPFIYLLRLGILAVATSLILLGCGGGGGGSSALPPPIIPPIDQPPTAQGQLVDAPVEGVSYQSGQQSGITGPNGEFVYEIGKAVRFFIGPIELGETLGKALVTPLDLASDGATATDGALNLARFLQSLDADVNDARITIPAAVRQQAAETVDPAVGLDFQNPAVFSAEAPRVLKRITTGVTQYNVVVNLVDKTTAGLHLQSSLRGFGIHVDIPGQTPAGNPAGLTRFASASALETYLKEGLRRGVETGGYWQNLVNVEASATAGTLDAVSAPGGIAGEKFSTTNLQETGVDEADLIKSDGRHLFVAKNPFVGGGNAIILPMPGPGGTTAPDPVDPVIRVLEVSSQPPASVPRAEVPLTDFGPIDGLYLVNGRPDGKPDLLAAVGGRPDYLWHMWVNPWFWQSGKTEIALYNVGSPATPAKLARISLEGQLIASRRIDDVLYVVTRYTPYLPDFKVHPLNAQEVAANEALLNQTKLANLLPRLIVNGVLAGSLVRPDVCFLPPRAEGQPAQADLISVTAVNLNAPETPVTQTIVAATETVYVSPQSLYLATTRRQYRGPGPLWAEIAASNAEIPEIPPEITDIHHFALTPEGPRYQGSGAVTGHLGWEVEKRPFRFSEQGGVLRVATSLDGSWNVSSRTRLSLLRPVAGDSGTSLQEISFIDNIGKPGERLYAVRYVENRAYLVTFRVTDPLYVFDLSHPENPVQLGELHIDGYSDYLHPIGDNLLLGIGKAAVPDLLSPDFGWRGAWYQGVKLSLFDVVDPAAPREVSSVVLGKRGTESAVLANHHALTYLASGNTGPARLAIPVELHDTVPQNAWFDPAMPSAYYDWTHTGLYLFEIDTGQAAGIRSSGRMVVSERSAAQPYEPPGGTHFDRSVLAGESVHYVHQGRVWSMAWNDPGNLSGPQ